MARNELAAAPDIEDLQLVFNKHSQFDRLDLPRFQKAFNEVWRGYNEANPDPDASHSEEWLKAPPNSKRAKDKRELEHLIAQLRAELERLRKALAEAEAARDAALRKAQGCGQDGQKLEIENAALRKRIEDLESELAKLRAQLDREREMWEQQRLGIVAESTETGGEVSALRAEKDELINALNAEKDAALAALRAELAAALAEQAARFQAQIDELMRKHSEEMQALRRQCDAMLEAMQAKLNEAIKERDDALKALEEMKAYYEQLIADLKRQHEQELARIRAELARARQENEDLLAKLRAELTAARNMVISQGQLEARLATLLADLEAIKAEAARYRAERDVALQEELELRQKFDELQAVHQRLMTEMQSKPEVH